MKNVENKTRERVSMMGGTVTDTQSRDFSASFPVLFQFFTLGRSLREIQAGTDPGQV